MNKTAIKNYAIWARVQLIEAVKQKAFEYEITEDGENRTAVETINGHVLSSTEKEQRRQLIEQINQKGYTQVMEEAAYTWFNRFIALRFMEVNGYLPSKVRVFTDENEEFKPEILKQAMTIELGGLDRRKVLELLEKQANEELYKYLLITQCNALNESLPYMFEQIANWTELLFPANLLRPDSVIGKMVTMIPREDWTDQVQIIGWLYQYYNTEPKDKVFADLKKNIKISKENIPAATQLFTPDWIVHYMVENSLGRLWLEGHPESKSKMLPTPEEQEAYVAGNREKDDPKWHYYLEEAKQEPEVEAQLTEIRKEYAALKPEEIKVNDPCCGSGHILCVLFDVLIRIYEDSGYSTRDAASLIIEKNLWGLDIDERAAQLSYFAVMMKARQYDRRFFTRNVQPHVYAIEESNGITSASLHDMGSKLSLEEYGEAVKQAMRLVDEMYDAKEYGSVIHVTPCDWGLLRRFTIPRDEDGQLHLDIHGEIETSGRLQRLICLGEALSQKYDAVVTNPPYMGSTGMQDVLVAYLKKWYPPSRSDLCTVFMEKTLDMCNPLGMMSMINTPAWMTMSSFEIMRETIINENTFVNMAHFGRGIFGADFGTTSFVIKKMHIHGYQATYLRLFERFGLVDTLEQKEKWFMDRMGLCTANSEDFRNIPSMPIAYWISKEALNMFGLDKHIGSYGKALQGTITGDNNKFLRMWFEVSSEKTAFHGEEGKKWYAHNKGGNYRKWYGNREYLIDWEDNGYAIRNFKDDKGKLRSRPQNIESFFIEGISWSDLTAGKFSARYYPAGGTFDATGPTIPFRGTNYMYYILGYVNTPVFQMLLDICCPGIHYNNGVITGLPINCDESIKEKVETLVIACVKMAKEDWDNFESSWDFKEHPFITSVRWAARSSEAITAKQAFEGWQGVAEGRFSKLRENEEELNRIFINLYGLENELCAEVEDKYVTVRKADYQRDVRSFISYAVGCMFGRYSLDKPGLLLAGYDKVEYRTVTEDSNDPELDKYSIPKPQNLYELLKGVRWVNQENYPSFNIDIDNIIPICDDEYFEDDIVGRFIRFVEVVFGKEMLEENLRFIADALGGKGSSRDVIRNYFINDFYADHLKVYQKRPIYWLFSSGKKNGFKALIYMHRYQPDLLARMRTDYVHEQQERYRTQLQMLEEAVQTAAPSERVKLNKKITKLKDQALELQQYEEKLHHLADQMISIDLDDGVKVNYAKFQDVLEKIK